MTQTIERLELPTDTYHALEQIARARSVSPSELVTDLVRQFQAMENAAALREEYQRLTDKALTRRISREEEKRLDLICAEINAANRQSNAGYALEQTNRRAEELIAKSEALIALTKPQAAR